MVSAEIARDDGPEGMALRLDMGSAIGDRLDLMLETGTQGIDTLDPPPLGTVELQDAKRQLAGRAFIKGNVDPVDTVLWGGKVLDPKDSSDKAIAALNEKVKNDDRVVHVMVTVRDGIPV